MTESELVGLSLEASDAVLQVVALYFSMVSAYVVALYYFLHRSPFLLKAVAFLFLSGAFGFLGVTIIAIERTTTGIVKALHQLEARTMLPPAESYYFGLDTLIAGHVEYGVLAGWAMAGTIYLGLAYLTFLHRWRKAEESGLQRVGTGVSPR